MEADKVDKFLNDLVWTVFWSETIFIEGRGYPKTSQSDTE